MADLEKVIKALTECIFLHENPDDDAGCFECPYRPDAKGTCPTMIPFLKDALELLQEPEPVPVEVHEKDEWYGPYLSCPECGTEWMADADKTHYCPGCGRRVVWEVAADGRA